LSREFSFDNAEQQESHVTCIKQFCCNNLTRHLLLEA